MAKIQLKSDYPHNHISVPRVFIDKYMADANGEFVKVYLFLLRCMGSSATSDFSISAIADHFNYTEKDILRALKYWEKVGVISLELNEKNQLTGLCFKDLTGGVQLSKVKDEDVITLAPAPITESPVIEASAEEKPAPAPKTTKSKKTTATKKREYSLDEKKALSNNQEFSELISVVETFVKRFLNSTEQDTLIFWYDELRLSYEVIIYLVEYCLTKNHSSFHYMNTIALDWAENNIDTVEKAQQHAEIRSKACYSIMKAFGISGRSLADSEMDFVNKWTKEYAFDIEIIQDACKRTISATSKPSFEYADTILTNWYSNNVHTLKDIASLDEVFNKSKRTTTTRTATTSKRNKFNNFHQREYDPDEYEKMILTASLK